MTLGYGGATSGTLATLAQNTTALFVAMGGGDFNGFAGGYGYHATVYHNRDYTNGTGPSYGINLISKQGDVFSGSGLQLNIDATGNITFTNGTGKTQVFRWSLIRIQ